MYRKRIFAVILSLIVGLTSVPVNAGNVTEAEINVIEDRGLEEINKRVASSNNPGKDDIAEILSVSDNTKEDNVSKNSVSSNVWDLISLSGKEPVPMRAKDGKFYIVKGAKFNAGVGASSSDKKALKIDKKGNVKVKKGSATLTSEKYGNIDITVISPKLSSKKESLQIGDNTQLSLSDVPDGLPVSWISSDQNIVQVYNGKCVAVGIGKATVTAYINGKGYKCKINVKDKENSTLLYNISTEGKPVKIKGLKGKLTFEVSDNSVTINKNTIKISSSRKTPVSGNASDGHKLWIYLNDTKPVQESFSLKIGESAYVFPDNCHEFPDFKSKNPEIATVNERGIIIGQAPGKTKIQGKLRGQKIKLDVTVSDEIYKGAELKERNIVVIDPINNNTPEETNPEKPVEEKNEPIIPELPSEYDNNDTPNPPSKEYHTVTVDTDGGIFNIKHIYVKSGDKFPLFSKKPEKENYTFLYWEIEGKELNKDTIIDHDTTIIARYKKNNSDNPEIKSYTVTFDSNGGSAVKPQIVSEGEKVTKPENPVKEKSVFNGWNYESYLFNFQSSINEDLTLKAEWETDENNDGVPDSIVNSNEKVTVAFDLNDGFIDSILEGDTVIKHVNKDSSEISDITPKREGYTFDGWHYPDGTKYEDGDIVNSDTVLTAHWKNNKTGKTEGSKYVYVFINDSFGYVYTEKINKGDKINIPVISRNGFKFDHWKYEDGTTYNINDTFNESKMIYAIWEPIESKNKGIIVSFNPRNGEEIFKQIIPYNGSIEAPTDPVYHGHSFKGWYYDGQLFSFTTPIRTNIDLYAVYDEYQYTINYNGNNEAGTKKTSIVKYSDRIIVNDNGFTNPGYEFLGYSENKNATVPEYGKNTYLQKLVEEDGGEITLFAVWKATPVKYTVIHKKQNIGGAGYTEAGRDTLRVLAGSKVTPAVKTYTGFTSPETKEVTIKGDGSTVVNYEYKRNQYQLNVSKDDNTEAVSGSGTFYYDEPVTVNATLKNNFTTEDIENNEHDYKYKKKYNYTFDKWSNGGKTASYTFNMPAENIDVKAQSKETVTKVNEQYKVSVSKGDNVIKVSPEGTNWYDKDINLTVTAAYDDEYTVKGTGTYKIDGSKNIVVTATLAGNNIKWTEPLAGGEAPYNDRLDNKTPEEKQEELKNIYDEVFKNDVSDEEHTGWKIIEYTDPNGETKYADPYEAENIDIKPGTSISFIVVLDEDNGYKVVKTPVTPESNELEKPESESNNISWNTPIAGTDDTVTEEKLTDIGLKGEDWEALDDNEKQGKLKDVYEKITDNDSEYKGIQVIKYTDSEGNIKYANPYETGNIEIEPGTKVHVIKSEDNGSGGVTVKDTPVSPKGNSTLKPSTGSSEIIVKPESSKTQVVTWDEPIADKNKIVHKNDDSIKDIVDELTDEESWNSLSDEDKQDKLKDIYEEIKNNNSDYEGIKVIKYTDENGETKYENPYVSNTSGINTEAGTVVKVAESKNNQGNVESKETSYKIKEDDNGTNLTPEDKNGQIGVKPASSTGKEVEWNNISDETKVTGTDTHGNSVISNLLEPKWSSLSNEEKQEELEKIHNEITKEPVDENYKNVSVIIYTDEDGHKKYGNPYEENGQITVQSGTSVSVISMTEDKDGQIKTVTTKKKVEESGEITSPVISGGEVGFKPENSESHNIKWDKSVASIYDSDTPNILSDFVEPKWSELSSKEQEEKLEELFKEITKNPVDDAYVNAKIIEYTDSEGHKRYANPYVSNNNGIDILSDTDITILTGTKKSNGTTETKETHIEPKESGSIKSSDENQGASATFTGDSGRTENFSESGTYVEKQENEDTDDNTSSVAPNPWAPKSKTEESGSGSGSQKEPDKPTITTYKVIHKTQNIGGDGYTTVRTQVIESVPYREVTPVRMDYEGFTAPQPDTKMVRPDGSTEIVYEYTRNKYTLTLNKGDYITGTLAIGDSSGNPLDNKFWFGETVHISSTVKEPTKETEDFITEGGYRYKKQQKYKFKEWTNKRTLANTTITMGAADITLTAKGERDGFDQVDKEYHLTLTAGTNIKSVSNVENDGWYSEGSHVRISAVNRDKDTDYTENNGYRYKKTYVFEKWSDNDVNNERTLVMNQSYSLTASGKEGIPANEEYLLTLSKNHAIKDISISGEGVHEENTAIKNTVDGLYALKFSSDSDFILKVENKNWDGTLEYSINNGNTWITWDGSELSGTEIQPIYVRGTNNTKITGEGNDGKWTFTGKYCTGNIENLLDYQTVTNNEHLVMADDCYTCMFFECTSLITPPTLPATTLKDMCYAFMFYGCTSLKTLPELPATIIDPFFYDCMFSGCTSIKLSETKTDEYKYPYRIPSSGTGADIDGDTYNVVQAIGNTGGTYTGDLYLNTTYYTDHEPVSIPKSVWVDKDSEVSISAVPQDNDMQYIEDNGYRYKKTFTLDKWSDNNTNATRTITMDKAYSLTAIGKEGAPEDEEYKLTLSKGTNIKSVSVLENGGWYAKGSTVNISATPNDTDMGYTEDNGYRYKKTYVFDKWSDGNTNAERTVTMNEAINLTATGKEGTPANEEYLLTLNAGDNIDKVIITSGEDNISGYDTNTNKKIEAWVKKGESVEYDCEYPEDYTEDTYTESNGYRYKKTHTYSFDGWTDLSVLNNSLKFSSDEPFTLAAPKIWDGTLEYTLNNGKTWVTWDGSELSGTATQPIYLRGTGNSIISSRLEWIFTGKYCTGNIENLLDYQTVANGEHPIMDEWCYSKMFGNCISLTQAPKLPATTLAKGCYYCMFDGCTSLTTVPKLPTTALAEYCYGYMFRGCTSLKLSATQTGAYQYEYRIPTLGTGTIADNALVDMFTNTGGTFAGTPEINTTYYTEHKSV